MPSFARGFIRAALLGCFILTLITLSLLYDRRAARYGGQSYNWLAQQHEPKQKSHNNYAAHNRLDLDEKQCRTAYPLLFTDSDGAVARGKFKLDKTEAEYKGLVQGRILNNNRTAILSQLHRAILTSPSALANTYFAFTINDVPKNDSWGFARPNKDTGYDIWIMPSFSGWSWPKAGLGSMDDVLQKIERVEDKLSWDQKESRVIWRGTPWFNPLGHPDLRKDLLKVARGKHWASVEALNETNKLDIEEFCKYKYIVYTEGVTYSGRLPYHQACGSVLLMAPLEWVSMSAVLVRPILAGDVVAPSGVDVEVKDKEGKVEGVVKTVASWEGANAIYVKPDFSDLEAVVEFLEERQEVARRIARNQRELVVDGGYLSTSAETCYWRALIKGWSEVAVVDEAKWGDETGERYETWLVKEVSRTREGTRGRIGNISGGG
ncbi:hypothetical protein EK21DRAFT_58695 [Setomelanomma holmii]|uniref:Glycosyl transferase CAP10 domain-containing protein n=1 Tax=Setomelanomma holmii TaxID=210430 RepID=A0A9P4LS73_9PLEO|nr:hypothetical protein EK21DRAFT_58695 [Setomelanomma holmii]